ncbi:lactonase family protein [Roseivirga thermotolerans]|uniref:6-phosphogluconolactonase n=1 Tax=Roseivirga thermotolerans TaxID=1758176 RepID=A0ABQ3HZQ1_9BACT|nr:lactonase family protein [Roseivirga thermotolerans]GHE51162.1 6-phosphogluconolactonase [Roseivirga thermotolerans]
MKKIILLALLALITACGSKKTEQQVAKPETDEAILFVGTYTKKEGHVDGQGEGVYVYSMNKKTGAIAYKSTSERVISPSYLAVHPSGNYVYAVNEFDGGEDSFAAVTAFSYDHESYTLSYVNETSSMGQYPCHLSIDNTGKFVMVANYVGGSVVLLPIEEGGMLGTYTSYKKHEGGSEHPRQEAPHAHQIIQHPKSGLVAAVDLGADKIYAYELDTLSRTLNYLRDFINPPRMAGPRHIVFHPEKDIVYVLNELIGTIEVATFSDSLRLEQKVQMIALQEHDDKREPSGAAIKIHPNGQFLYASNRGEINEILAFKIGGNGELIKIGAYPSQGKTPRDFEIDPSGKFMLVANQDTNTIVTYEINQETGELIDTGYIEEVPTPVCIKFLVQ